MTIPDPSAIAEQFAFPAPVKSIQAYGGGIINDTYLVNFADVTVTPGARTGQKAILQRINSAVFSHPEWIMHNLQIVLAHTEAKLAKSNSSFTFTMPPIYRTKDDLSFYRDHDSHCWRAMGFIERTRTYDTVTDQRQAHEAGMALSRFHLLMDDLPIHQLKDTLPGFHVTPRYLQHFDTVWANTQRSKRHTKQEIGIIDECIRVINEHRSLAGVLENADPPLPLQVIHGDPKLNNFLFDQQSETVVSLIDLDTVKPGLLHYDLGDRIRSTCYVSGEFPDNIESVVFDRNICEALLQGYIHTSAARLRHQDLDLVYDCIRLLPFELGLRFFTDHLLDDRYFKVQSPGDNLYRARVQFRLLRSVEQQASEIRKLIKQLS